MLVYDAGVVDKMIAQSVGDTGVVIKLVAHSVDNAGVAVGTLEYSCENGHSFYYVDDSPGYRCGVQNASKALVNETAN